MARTITVHSVEEQKRRLANVPEDTWENIKVVNVANGREVGWWVVPKGVHPPYPYDVVERHPYPGLSVELSPGATSLLRAYANDAANWSGVPLVGGNVPHRKADDGWLTELKMKGLVATQEDNNDPSLRWLYFTGPGKQFVKMNFEIDIEDPR